MCLLSLIVGLSCGYHIFKLKETNYLFYGLTLS